MRLAFDRSRRSRTAMACVALLLLLFGGNLCLLAGLAAVRGGTVPMGVLTLARPATSADAPAPSAGGCCTRGGARGDGAARARGVAPCCMALVTVSAPAPADPAARAAPQPAPVACAVIAAPPPVVARTGAPERSAPPEPPRPAPRAARAPPLL